MDRVYDALRQEHLEQNRQIAMITGPRQMEKKTSSRLGAGDHGYYSWDQQSDRVFITRGADAVAVDLDRGDRLPRAFSTSTPIALEAS